MDRSTPLSVKDKIKILRQEGLLKYFWGQISIHCGNIGTVFLKSNPTEACVTFYDYREQSREGVGRAAGECIAVFRDDELIYEYIPENYDSDE